MLSGDLFGVWQVLDECLLNKWDFFEQLLVGLVLVTQINSEQ